MIRRIHTPALLALLAALVLALVGCGGTTTGADAEAARACVQTAMEDVRTQAPDARQTVLDELESHVEKPLAKMGVSAEDLVDDYFRDFSFEVGEATVTGNSAQVSVSVTCRPVRDIVTQLVEKCAGEWERRRPHTVGASGWGPSRNRSRSRSAAPRRLMGRGPATMA